MTPEEQRILKVLADDGALTAREIARGHGLGINGRTVGPLLARMARDGLVRDAGEDSVEGLPVRRWAITEAGAEALRVGVGA